MYSRVKARTLGPNEEIFGRQKKAKITQINGKIWILNYLDRKSIHTQVLDNKVL